MSGTVGWGEAKAVQSNQRKEIERLKFVTGETTRVRLIGAVLPRYVYWITTSEGRKLPIECLKFDRSTGVFNENAKDPVDEIPDEIYGAGPNDKPQFAFVCNVIDREDNSVRLFDLKKTIYSQIVDLAQNPDFGNPADDKNGYILSIKKEKTGPQPQNVKYVVTPGRSNDPLTEDDLALELYDLEAIFKRQTYEEQKEWLMKNTNYFKLEGTEFSPESSEETMEDLTG